MKRTITKSISFLRRRVPSSRCAAAAGMLLLAGWQAEAHPVKRPGKDTTRVAGDTLQSVPILYGRLPQRYITGAVSFVSGATVSNAPGTSRLNTFAGRLPGLTVTQLSGLPSSEFNSYQIRGFHSFAGSGQPVILINNRRDDFNEIEPNDIESVTVLKDAGAAAMYGFNSANGLILVTTKRGKMGRVRVDFNTQTTFEQPTRLPKFLDSYNYATLYNEAQLNDNPAATPKYNAATLQAYQTGGDPYLYPNVNWKDQTLKKYSLQTRNQLSVYGGSDQVKYYVSGSFLNDNGLFKTDPSINTYSTNNNLNVLNVRGNLDINVSKNFMLLADFRSKREVRNAPGAYSTSFDQSVLGAIYSTPNNAYPVRNADGSLGGSATYTNNPLGLLNYAGYSNLISTSMTGSMAAVYNLKDITPGLKARVDFGFTNYDEMSLSRSKTFAVYALNTAVTPNTYTKIGTDGVTANNGSGGYTARTRIYDHFATLSYDRVFGDHSISALGMYEIQQIDDFNTSAVTQNYQGPKGRISYRFKDRYLLDVSGSYQGNEQYPAGHRYGFFPAIGAGWIISDESFLKNSGINFLKVRGSYGKTANPASGVFFDYLTSYALANGNGGAFGTNPSNAAGAYQNQIGNPLITWETDLKTNLGLDLAILKNRLTASVDLFKERTTNILVTNAISAMYGANINTPSGVFENRGLEVQAGWNNKIGRLQYFINGNVAVAKNKIIDLNEATKPYPWMYLTGNSLGVRTGYVFDRYFTEADVAGSYPNQTAFGSQKPGDLKYKDLNGDGVIDANDITVIGLSRNPEMTYGVNLGFKLNAFDLSVFFEGTSHSSTYNSGATYWEFTGSGKGNVVEHHLDRWTPNSGQSAAYPRLTLTNANNFVTSSYWVQDNSFTRLKYTELGFQLPAGFIRRAGLSSARLFVNGYNLAVWSKVKEKDPEATESGLTYPLQRSFSVGLNVKF